MSPAAEREWHVFTKSLSDVTALLGAVEAPTLVIHDSAFPFGSCELCRDLAAGTPTSELTRRESEVLRMIAEGRTNKEIAAKLALSERTVARHITNLYAKIDVRSKFEATAYALKNGLN